MRFNENKLAAVAMLGALATASLPSFATGIDVTAVTTALGDTSAPIAAIGGAVLLVLVGIKAYRWVRRAM